jgi:hypothetical protein
MIRSGVSRGADIYKYDYEALKSLRPIAEKHSVAIAVVHHARKQGAADPMDEISASTGLLGGVDGAILLRDGRAKGERELVTRIGD